jgi:endonuclease G
LEDVVRDRGREFSEYLGRLRELDPEVSREIEESAAGEPRAESPSEARFEMTPEAIVLTSGRPVLDVKRGEAVLDMDKVDSRVWRQRLEAARLDLADNIASVGRIELDNDLIGRDWVGTGWLLRDNIVVTNRHVAELFARASGDGFVFRTGLDGNRVRASIDFLEEFGSDDSLEMPLFKVVHLESDAGPDIAFLRIEPAEGADLPSPISLASQSVRVGDRIGVIGYPARDPFFPNPELMDRLFDHRYDKKRFAPGLVQVSNANRVLHDCTTLGGNSGAQIVTLDGGEAVALHFAGTMFKENHAIPAHLVAQRLDDVLRGSRARRRADRDSESLLISARAHATGTERFAAQSIDATIPVRIRIELGDPTTARAVVPGVGGAPMARPPTVATALFEDDVEEVTEARPEDYLDRNGYDPTFLGDGIVVPLPELTRLLHDVLTFDFDNQSREVLDYRHFSVLMSRSRRLCRYSACNIDGRATRREDRKSWRFDPRIPEEAQIKKECYGDPPRFSRGHMTRRNDPSWGDHSEQGNTDSMHVTNAVPQMQPFNGGIWLDLEDYALENARRDDMRISVITGPFLLDDDPVRFGVRIPLRFWKIIAFIHDDTGELAATGYTMNQSSFLSDEEFVFGQHECSQRPIFEIEQSAGLSFGQLADVDPMREMIESAPTLLTDPHQIRWR